MTMVNGHDLQQRDDNYNNNIVKIQWDPIIGPKIKKELKKIGYKAVFTNSKSLKRILCNNKCNLTPHSDPGVYQLNCSCGSVYIGETKKKILTRSIEHQQQSMSRKWELSGATEHTKSCHGSFQWLNPTTLSVNSNYRHRKIRESLEINRTEVKLELQPHKLLNRDRGNIVDTNSWKPFFRTLEMTTKTMTSNQL